MPKITSHKVTGPLDLKGLESLLEDEYEFLDVSEAEMGIDKEQWEVCLGWSCHGPVYGRSGWRKVKSSSDFSRRLMPRPFSFLTMCNAATY